MSDSSKVPQSTPDAKPEPFFARFRSCWLPVLDEWQFDVWTNPSFPGVQIEPGEGGGVDLVANSPWALLVIHERGPKAEANGRAFLSLPQKLVKACREPKRVRLLDTEKGRPEYPMPEWMRPGDVHVHQFPTKENELRNLHVMVTPLADVPEDISKRWFGGDGAGLYSNVSHEALRSATDWRAAFASPRHAPRATEALTVNAEFLGRLRRLGRLLGECKLMFAGPNGGIVARFDSIMREASAEALIMPLSRDEAGQ